MGKFGQQVIAVGLKQCNISFMLCHLKITSAWAVVSLVYPSVLNSEDAFIVFGFYSHSDNCQHGSLCYPYKLPDRDCICNSTDWHLWKCHLSLYLRFYHGSTGRTRQWSCAAVSLWLVCLVKETRTTSATWTWSERQTTPPSSPSMMLGPTSMLWPTRLEGNGSTLSGQVVSCPKSNKGNRTAVETEINQRHRRRTSV